MQHITYDEYLPAVLSDKTMQDYELAPKQTGYADVYNSSVDPTVMNVFSTAAFRCVYAIMHSDIYCEFPSILIQRIFYFRIFSEFLNSLPGTRLLSLTFISFYSENFDVSKRICAPCCCCSWHHLDFALVDLFN